MTFLSPIHPAIRSLLPDNPVSSGDDELQSSRKCALLPGNHEGRTTITVTFDIGNACGARKSIIARHKGFIEVKGPPVALFGALTSDGP